VRRAAVFYLGLPGPGKSFWWWLVSEAPEVALAAAARHWMGWRPITERRHQL